MLEQLVAAGVIGALITGVVALVRIAVNSERRRADDWRTASETSRAANEVLANHVGKLVASIEQLTTTQREMMTLLRTIATGTEPR